MEVHGPSRAAGPQTRVLPEPALAPVLAPAACKRYNEPAATAGTIVPALPEKNVVEKYKMTTEFIETRRAALTVFINRVVSESSKEGLGGGGECVRACVRVVGW